MTGTEELSGIEGVAFVDGTYMPLREATIPLVERGFLRSDVTYDAIHVWKGKFFRLQDHIERFQASMQGLRLELPYSGKDIAEILAECVRRAELQDAFVMLMCTRGVTPAGTRDPRLCRNRFYAYAQPFLRIASAEQQERGLKMIQSKMLRIPSESLDQRIKNFHWLDLTMSMYEAYDRGAEVTILPATDGSITEGPGFNVFVIKDGVLATPEHGMFEGITRRTVMEIAADLQVKCEVRKVQGREFDEADEIFTCTTAGGITPVTEYEGRPVGDGKPGTLTSRLNEIYWQRHEDDSLTTAIDYGA